VSAVRRLRHPSLPGAPQRLVDALSEVLRLPYVAFTPRVTPACGSLGSPGVVATVGKYCSHERTSVGGYALTCTTCRTCTCWHRTPNRRARSAPRRRRPQTMAALARELRDRLRQSVADVRSAVHGLRLPILDQLGLTAALRELGHGYETPEYSNATSPTTTSEPTGKPTQQRSPEQSAHRRARTPRAHLVLDPAALPPAHPPRGDPASAAD
jgi:hypothetical protein